MEIKTIENKEKLKEVFDFLSKLFCEEAKKNNEHYYTMSERFVEMSEQLKKDNELLLYIEYSGEIVAALTSKGMDIENKKITLGVMGVSEDYRKKGYARFLIEEFEKRCKAKEITHIDLGSRINACPLYIAMKYKPSLMVQVFDFETINEIKKVNTFNLKEKLSWQGDTYGFILFDISEVDEKYIKFFETKMNTAHAQFIFKKDL